MSDPKQEVSAAVKYLLKQRVPKRQLAIALNQLQYLTPETLRKQFFLDEHTLPNHIEQDFRSNSKVYANRLFEEWGEWLELLVDYDTPLKPIARVTRTLSQSSIDDYEPETKAIASPRQTGGVFYTGFPAILALMITPSHIIYSWALAKKTASSVSDTPNAKRRTLAFVLGALFPDTPTYLFFIVCGLILSYSGEAMWDDMYFNSGWSIPITLTHSFLLWPLLIAISSYFGLRFLRWFSISALFHALVDFCVHTDDAYRHFYPFINWKFHSPISYYNSREYGQYVSAFDSLLVLVLLTYLYTKYKGRWRILIVAVGVLYTIRLVAEPLIMIFTHAA